MKRAKEEAQDEDDEFLQELRDSEMKELKTQFNITALRQYVQNGKAPLLQVQENKWILDVPQEIRDTAVLNFTRGVKSAFSNGHTFKMRFASRRAPQQSMNIRARQWNLESGKCAPLLGPKVLMHSHKDPLPDVLPSDAKLIRTRTGKYYMCIPEPAPMYSTVPSSDVIGIDPGVKTLLTCYDPAGEIIEWGTEMMQWLNKSHEKVSRMDSIIATSPKRKTRRHCQRKKLLLLEKFKNRVQDMHKKAAKFLCASYKCIVLPKLDTKRLSRKAGRKLNRKTTRNMLSQSHAALRKRICEKAKQYEDRMVIISSEPYTSQTCTRCCHIYKVSGKHYKCKECGLNIDRDFNGARNNLLHVLEKLKINVSQAA